MKTDDEKLFEEFMAFKQFKESQQFLKKKKIPNRRKYTVRKNGTYSTQITVGHDDNTGKPIRITLYAKTIVELDAKVDEVKIEKQRGTNFSKRNLTVKQYRKTWYETKCLSIEINTKKMYESVFSNYFSTIDDMRMIDVEYIDLQTIINNFKEKPRTCQKIKLTFSQIFKSALRERIISFNPADGLVLPIYKARERRTLTDDEEYLTENTDFTDREKAFVLLLKYFGLRKEEALALEKHNFDFKKQRLHIKNALITDNNEPIIKDTKNHDERILPITSNVEPFLKYYISNLATNILFTNITNDKRITDTGYRRMWESIIRKMEKKAVECKRNVSPGLTAYIFRHNYACMLMYAGIDMKERQYLLGHRTISMTMDVYTHIETEKMEAPSRLNQYLNNERRLS